MKAQKAQQLTVASLTGLLKQAQEKFCHEDMDKGMDFAESYGITLAPILSLPAREIQNVMELAKVEHHKYEEAEKAKGVFDVYGDPDWAKWYAEFALPYFTKPETEGDNSQFTKLPFSM